ncbi:hypothetical protein PFISCL1PPCAC_15132 [Pristionchus fissidentatus]|uniref:Major facilitator superfamily (MFS) profile domain-containing protein n=1 Tax=Pristionchus fissidentatus TaxID=1538716 RepID=A0AAV5W0L0_9BILA|nr:hypothetical protein PFISCL1PPCAC_15132 [Pristionchus fissidentatus]
MSTHNTPSSSSSSSQPLLLPSNYDPPPVYEIPSEDPVSTPESPVKQEEEKKNVDSFLRLSWYCARILLLSEFILLGSAGNMVYLVYAGAAPKSVPCVGDGFTIPDICKIPKEDRSNFTCTYQPEYEFYSLNVEFKYFCEETSTVKMTVSFQMAGILFGALFWGFFADAKGRRLALMITFSVTIVLSILNAMVTSLIMFNVVRTIHAFFNGGALIVYGVYKMEHVPRQHRFLISSLIAWAPNYILITILAWLSRDWRTYQLVIVAASLPAFPFFYFTYESPRWLIQRGKIQEARIVLERMQEIDGVSEAKREDMQKMIDEEHEKFLARERKAKNYNITHLFRHADMALATMILSIGVMITSMIGYGLMFNLETLSGSLYLNSIYLGLMRWALNITTGIVDFKVKWAGRKLFHTIGQGIVAIGLFMLGWTHLNGKEHGMEEVVRISTLFSAAFVSQTFISKGMLAMEYFPTVVRNSAMSFKTTFSRLGAVIAPQIFLLPLPWMPYAFLCILALIDTAAFLIFIPETKGKPLPETMPEKKKKGTNNLANLPIQSQNQFQKA